MLLPFFLIGVKGDRKVGVGISAERGKTESTTSA